MTPRPQLAADTPLAQRLVAGLRYPVTGGALATCVVLGLCRYVTFLVGHLPSLGGLLAIAVAIAIWWGTWRYAIDCMVQTADGFAEPPEVSLEDHAGSPRNLLGVHLLVVAICVLVMLFAPAHLWMVLVSAAVLLPAIDMSLAFDGSLAVALNPVTWIGTIVRFGLSYLIPVAANIVLALLIWFASAGTSHLPALLALPLYGFACTYLVLLDFHWMGLLVWHYRERLGMHPRAPELARAMALDADGELLQECQTLATTDPEQAAIRLRDRIRERSAPAPVHSMFRSLLHKLQRNDLLLQHGQTWIAQLCANGEARRALGVVQECREVDPAFIPDAPENTAMLAELAARIGMRDLSSHLARGFGQRWPRHEAGARIAQLATDTSQTT
ncbi:MAG: hypothetical protein ACREPY_00500 [Rhodanobacteraceae bacterium]